MNILQSSLGHYEAIGNIDDADCVIGHSFGTSTDIASVNYLLADTILKVADDRPIVVDRTLANAFPDGDDSVDYIVEGLVSDTIGQGVGSWGTLLEAKDFMEERNLRNPLMLAQANHIGRVVMQANRLSVASIVPAGLPDRFDTRSDQIWTRSLGLWVPREVIGAAVLRFQGKL